MAETTKTLTDAEMLALAKHVRENDLLLAGRDPSDAPEGAGGWRYLLADAMGVAREDVSHVTVPTDEVKRLREIDRTARVGAKPAKAPAKRSTRRRTTRKAAPAKAQSVEVFSPADVEAMVARAVAAALAGK